MATGYRDCDLCGDSVRTYDTVELFGDTLCESCGATLESMDDDELTYDQLPSGVEKYCSEAQWTAMTPEERTKMFCDHYHDGYAVTYVEKVQGMEWDDLTDEQRDRIVKLFLSSEILVKHQAEKWYSGYGPKGRKQLLDGKVTDYEVDD